MKTFVELQSSWKAYVQGTTGNLPRACVLGGCRHSGSGSQGRKRKQQPQDSAVSSQAALHAATSGKSAQKDAKRRRSAVTAAASSPQNIGQLAHVLNTRVLQVSAMNHCLCTNLFLEFQSV